MGSYLYLPQKKSLVCGSINTKSIRKGERVMDSVKLTNVDSQSDLDAVETTGIVSYAKVTAEFGIWKLNDLLVYTDTDSWELLVRQGSVA